LQLRRKARRIALETLYEIDCADHPATEVLQRRLTEEELDAPTVTFLYELVTGVVGNHAALDRLIQEFAPEWPVEQMAIIDRNILRMAIFELVVSQQTPLKVAINEAVELAKLYGSDSAPRFVNGVLGTLASRHNELISSFRRSTETGEG
jgi:N utilization substance protein B